MWFELVVIDLIELPTQTKVLKQQVVQLYSSQTVTFHVFMLLAIHRIGIVKKIIRLRCVPMLNGSEPLLFV